jgi:hypothetical protein
MGEEKTLVRFIKCTEEDLIRLRAAQKETEIKINLNLDKEPEENPIEKLIKELEEISI